jgi:hypothetical protein
MVKPSKTSLTRDESLAARPRKMPVIRRQDLDEGRTRITVQLRRPRWQRALGGSEIFERTYGLDPLGCEVYDACDGRSSVRTIMKRVADRHHISVGEAELSVTTFLKTLTAKGLIGMELDTEGP